MTSFFFYSPSLPFSIFLQRFYSILEWNPLVLDKFKRKRSLTDERKRYDLNEFSGVLKREEEKKGESSRGAMGRKEEKKKVILNNFLHNV